MEGVSQIIQYWLSFGTNVDSCSSVVTGLRDKVKFTLYVVNSYIYEKCTMAAKKQMFFYIWHKKIINTENGKIGHLMGH